MPDPARSRKRKLSASDDDGALMTAQPAAPPHHLLYDPYQAVKFLGEYQRSTLKRKQEDTDCAKLGGPPGGVKATAAGKTTSKQLQGNKTSTKAKPSAEGEYQVRLRIYLYVYH
jgi:hypothetical protein